MYSKKYKRLLSKVSKIDDRESLLELQELLSEDSNFINFLKNTYDFTHQEHDGLIKILDIKKNSNGYYEDKYGQRISYNGIRTLKKSKTEISLNVLHKIETDKCTKDFKYFRAYYCFITTKHGLARPELRHYQENLEDELLSLEDLIILYPRQSGKTISVATYLLWLALYHPNKINIGIVANKPKTAREVLDKIKKIFIELPIWLMNGVEVWNKSEIEFDTGTRIMTDSPSSDSFRGYTCNIIYTDESAYIKKNLWDEFIDAVIPTMNSLIFKQVINTSTANGMNHFYHLVKGATPTQTKKYEMNISSEDTIQIGGIGIEYSPDELIEIFNKRKERDKIQKEIQWKYRDV